MSGRTAWLPKDAAWHRRGRIVEIGQEHGPAGPLVIDWLMCEARAQNELRTGPGTVKAGYAAIAHGCYLESAATAREIVQTAAQLELLDDFEEIDSRTFVARISGWHHDVNLPLEATRKAEERRGGTRRDTSGQPGTTGDNPPKNPETSPTRQDKNNNTPQPPEGEQSGGGQVIKFDRRPVPADRLELAEQLLASFNETAKTGHGAYTGRGRPSESLTRIIGALTDWPDVTADEWTEVVKVGLKRNPFWEGRPTPGVVFGPAVVQRNIDEVRRRRPAAAGSRLQGIDFLNQRSSDD